MSCLEAKFGEFYECGFVWRDKSKRFYLFKSFCCDNQRNFSR